VPACTREALEPCAAFARTSIEDAVVQLSALRAVCAVLPVSGKDGDAKAACVAAAVCKGWCLEVLGSHAGDPDIVGPALLLLRRILWGSDDTNVHIGVLGCAHAWARVGWVGVFKFSRSTHYYCSPNADCAAPPPPPHPRRRTGHSGGCLARPIWFRGGG
jgi:hypothetical protein